MALPRPDCYVCIVSDHNFAELVCCMTRKPGRVLLVTSQRYEQEARRLQRVLERQPERPKTEILYGANLGGNDYAGSLEWARTQLLPELSGQTCVLNVTGGTKGMAFALATASDWSWLDYKALDRPNIEAFRLAGDRSGLLLEETPAADIGVREAAELYSDIDWGKPDETLTNPDHRELAQAFWDAQQANDPGLEALIRLIAEVWVDGRNNEEWKRKRVSVRWSEISGEQRAGAKIWLERLASISDGAVSWDDDQITLPGNHRNLDKPAQRWKRWLSGEWLEQLGYHWLHDVLPEHHLALNPRSRVLQDSSESREADILALANGQTWVIEAKADIPPGSQLKSIEEQVSSLGENRFGKVRKAILCGPSLVKRINEERDKWFAFENRCKASQVALCTSREELLRAMGLANRGRSKRHDYATPARVQA